MPRVASAHSHLHCSRLLSTDPLRTSDRRRTVDIATMNATGAAKSFAGLPNYARLAVRAILAAAEIRQFTNLSIIRRITRARSERLTMSRSFPTRRCMARPASKMLWLLQGDVMPRATLP